MQTLNNAVTAAVLHAAPVLVVDFDDTITEGDTIGTLIDASIEAQARGDSTSQGQQNRRSALHSTKDRLVAEYVEAFQALTERHLPQRNMPAKDTGLNMELASGFLDDLNDFEQRMNAKVVESSILSGLQVCLALAVFWCSNFDRLLLATRLPLAACSGAAYSRDA